MQEEIVRGVALSPQQKHLWLLQRSGDNLPFRTTGAILIEGPINEAALTAALESVIARHEILRTIFIPVPDQNLPVQCLSGKRASVEKQDLSDVPRPEQDAEVERCLDEMRRLPFDYANGPLLRLKLFRLSPDEHQLILALPSLCADASTLHNLSLKLARAYAACLRGEAPPEESLQYADLSQWLNEILESEEMEIGREYWRQDRERLPPPHASLPFELEPRANSAFDPQNLRSRLDLETADRLELLVRKCATSLPAFLLACWQILLWRLTGESEIVIGVAFDGRRYDELREALGPLTKFLPLHCHLDENLSFGEALKRIDEAAKEAVRWQEAFTWPQIPAAGANTFEEAFPALAFEFERGAEAFSEGPLRFRLDRCESCCERFEVKLSCTERVGQLILNLHYDAAAYRRADMERLVEEFRALLESVLREPEGLIGKLEITGERELQQILFEFNRTEAHFPQERCLHQLFEEQAERTPDAVAVIFEEEQLSYLELNARANQLARHLCASGVGPEMVVGLYVERSLEMLVGILGILKAGAAYLPLDPHYPPQRIAFMLKDVGVRVLLTQGRLLKMLPPHAARVICLDSDWPSIAQEPELNLPNRACADNLAYVIYTSGSTGRPKGSMIAHRSLVNHALNMVKVYELKTKRRMMQFFSLSFDASAEDFFPTLLSGATLVCHPNPFACTIPEFMAFCQRHEITTLHLPVVFWHELVERLAHDDQTLPDSIEILSVGGESPSASKLLSWAERTGCRIRFRNVYGPTETTITSAVYETVCAVDKSRGSARVPIGRPINNTQLYLLDQHLRPVPLGVPGELHIGGVGLARGYLNRPDTTAERFIPNPFGSAPGTRLYRTGDQARYLPDGNLVFMGRLDQQVKIRGHRIEPGEIEAVLVLHPQVREAVVVAREERPGDNSLAAYLLSTPERTVTGGEIRDFLAGLLPDYMVPSVFVFVDQWPLMPNGKVDHHALPSPASMMRSGEYIAPGTHVEKVLASIWSEVLGVERVGVRDNFFELGGHSLLAAQVIAQVRESLQVELGVRSLFEEPTVAGLSVLLLRVSSEPAKTEERAKLLLSLSQLSDDEVEAMLGQKLQQL